MKNNEVLLVRRKKHPYQNHWALPGGRIEKQETPREAVIRELKEETNLTALASQFFGKYSFVWKGTEYVLHCFILETQDPSSLVAREDAASAKWYAIHNLPWKEMAPIVKKIIKDFLVREGQ